MYGDNNLCSVFLYLSLTAQIYIIEDQSRIAEMENVELIKSMPPSAKLVLRVLKEKKITRFDDLMEETLLSKRTLLYAIKALRELDLIETQVCMNDARKRFYCVKLR